MIPYVDLKVQYHAIREEVNREIQEVLETSQFVLGSKVKNFEEAFAAYCNVENTVAVNSGTSALHLALLAAGIGEGDEVITVPFTFIATAAAIRYAGAKPVFVDIDPVTFTMDPSLLEAAITGKTRAIMPVHLYGQCADMDPILEIARKHDLLVIEDAAQAHGAEYRGKRAGSMGDMGCFSFYPGKNLGSYGEGGAVVTNNSEFSEIISKMRDWGQSKKRGFHDLPGFNYRMTGFQGAVLGVKIRYIERWTEMRRSNAAYYRDILGDLPIKLPVEAEYNRHVYHVHAIQVENRDRVFEKLSASGVGCGVHYPLPVHLQEIVADLGYREGDFPVSENVAGHVLSIPMFPELTHDQMDTVAENLRTILL